MRILLAGATGQLGAGVVEAALAAGVEVHPAARQVGARAASVRISRTFRNQPDLAERTVAGDVTHPLWGLDAETLDSLARRIDAVVNLAGETNWASTTRQLFAVNAVGAVNGLEVARELARRAGRTIHYAYASSIYSAGGRTGTIPEEPFGPDRYRTPYEQSKWVAEDALLHVEREDEVPVTVVRVGGLIGNAKTGATAKRNSLYMLADRWNELPLGVLPVAPLGRVDMLPRDVAGVMLLEALAGLIREPPRRPELIHLCAGESAPTIEAVLAAARSLDHRGSLGAVRRLRTPARMALQLSLHLDRVHELGATWKNLVTGLRYLSLDRLFDRSRLAGRLGRAPDDATAEELARLCFELPSQSTLPPHPSALATFTG